jgi:uncharacterized membrane protein
MTWNQWYRLTSYVKSALWVVPVVAMLFEQATLRLIFFIDGRVEWTLLGLSVAEAQAMLQTVVTMTLSFIVFTFGSLLIAIQVAGGQLTPRIIATTLLQDNAVKYSVGLFVFVLLFAVGVLGRISSIAHQFVIFVAAVLGFSCIAVFLYLIDYAAKLLRPVSIVARVGQRGLAVIDSVYPHPTANSHLADRADQALGTPDKVVPHESPSEIVVAMNLKALAAEATRSDGIIEFVPQVGDFVGAQEPLFRLYGGARAVDASKLRAAVAFGSERTMEQDPMFAFRILVDIALKALSKAINDPTTAVLAIDQLQRLLQRVGNRDLRNELITDAAGRLRLIFRTPNWEDFVHLSCTEMRHNGAESIQVARRLRAMIETLIQTLPEHRHPALRHELKLLDLSVERLYVFSDDLALARIADSQGLGSSGVGAAS